MSDTDYSSSSAPDATSDAPVAAPVASPTAAPAAPAAASSDYGASDEYEAPTAYYAPVDFDYGVFKTGAPTAGLFTADSDFSPPPELLRSPPPPRLTYAPTTRLEDLATPAVGTRSPTHELPSLAPTGFERPFHGKRENFYDALSMIMLLYSVFSLFAAALVPHLLSLVGLYVGGAVVGMCVACQYDLEFDWREPTIMIVCAYVVGALHRLDYPSPPKKKEEVDEEEEERRIAAEEEMPPEELKKVKEARKKERRKQRRERLLANLAGDWGYVPYIQFALFTAMSFVILGVVCIDIFQLTHVPEFPHQRIIMQGGFGLVGLVVGYLMAEESVPLAACASGSYLMVAVLDWCGYRYEYEDDVLFWPTEFLMFDSTLEDLSTPWSIGMGFAWAAFAVCGYIIQRCMVRNPMMEKLIRERKKLQGQEQEDNEMQDFSRFDNPEFELDDTQMLHIELMRTKLQQQDALQERDKDVLRSMRRQMKRAMKKRGLDVERDDYRKLQKENKESKNYGSFLSRIFGKKE